MGQDAPALVFGLFVLRLFILLGFVPKYFLYCSGVCNSRPFYFPSSNFSTGTNFELAQIAHLLMAVCRSFISLRVVRSALVAPFALEELNSWIVGCERAPRGGDGVERAGGELRLRQTVPVDGRDDRRVRRVPVFGTRSPAFSLPSEM